MKQNMTLESMKKSQTKVRKWTAPGYSVSYADKYKQKGSKEGYNMNSSSSIDRDQKSSSSVKSSHMLSNNQHY